MGNYNKVLLMGNLTRDVELRHLPSGQPVGKLGLAVNRRYKNAAGELKEEVTFVDCEAWGKTAENIAKFFSKGKSIFLEGHLRLDTWQDKTDGTNRSKLKIVIENFEFVDSKGGGEGGGGGAPRNGSGQVQTRPTGGAPAPAAAGYEPIAEDDIPF